MVARERGRRRGAPLGGGAVCSKRWGGGKGPAGTAALPGDPDRPSRRTVRHGSTVKHFATVTNLPDPPHGSGLDLLHWHRGKAGTVEHAHRVLKDELPPPLCRANASAPTPPGSGSTFSSTICCRPSNGWRCRPSCTMPGPSACASCSSTASARWSATPARPCSGWSATPAAGSPTPPGLPSPPVRQSSSRPERGSCAAAPAAPVHCPQTPVPRASTPNARASRATWPSRPTRSQSPTQSRSAAAAQANTPTPYPGIWDLGVGCPHRRNGNPLCHPLSLLPVGNQHGLPNRSGRVPGRGVGVGRPGTPWRVGPLLVMRPRRAA